MIHSTEIQNRARKENDQKLWDVFEAYKNDTEGLTRYQLAELADFNGAEGDTPYNIFDRALKVCRRRAEKAGMLIPHATPGEDGYVYFLTDRPGQALGGFISAERVSAGMRRSVFKHQKFIETDTSELSPVEKVLFQEVAQVIDERQQVLDNELDKRMEMLEKLRQAKLEESAEAPIS